MTLCSRKNKKRRSSDRRFFAFIFFIGYEDRHGGLSLRLMGPYDLPLLHRIHC